MPEARRFAEVDVFGRDGLRGNPVAVVVDADGLSEAAMAAFAVWTNLSETTFLLPPSDAGRAAGADYRLRIFTPGGELLFAGHPTLGSAHAWLAAGGEPAAEGVLVQECGIGLVTLRRDGERLSFAAPALLRSGDVDEVLLADVVASLRVPREAVLSSAWTDNGPGWLTVELDTAAEVLALRPDFGAMTGLEAHGVGVFGRYPEGEERAIEVRAFVPGIGVNEDPVTGSLNAGIARWLIESGRVTSSYLAGQGSAIGRDGLVHVTLDAEGEIWIGGRTATVIEGAVTL